MKYCESCRTLILAVAAVCSLPFASVLAAGLTIGAGGEVSLGAGSQDLDCGDLVVNGTLNLNTGTLNNVGNVTINSTGIINGNSGTINMSGDWTNNSGTFNAGTSQVTVNQVCTNDVNVSGDSAFYNLTVQTNIPRTITFAAGSTTTVTGNLLMNGSSTGFPANLLKIRSSTPGSEAFLVVTGTYTIDRVDVEDNHAQLSGQWIDWGPPVAFQSVDGGGNFRWFRSGTKDGVLSFTVTKSFDDSNPGKVLVHIRCNNGLPLSQSQLVSENGSVTFLLTHIDATVVGPNCRIWEEQVSGYDDSYNSDPCNEFTGSCNDVSDGDEPGCYYEDLHPRDFSEHNQCAITNTPLPATFTVNKDWVVIGSGGDLVEQFAHIKIWCDAAFPGGTPSGPYWYAFFEDTGDFNPSVSVVPDYPYSTCWAAEIISDDAVESQNDCDGDELVAGGSAGCDITNTVYFEGIPTLNQYGLAILALLMLSVGLIGYRRMM